MQSSVPGAYALSEPRHALSVVPHWLHRALPTDAVADRARRPALYEIKHDGFRFVAHRDGYRIRVFSRQGKDWSDRVPAIVEALAALPVTSVTLDGEGVICDQRGVSDFDQLFAALACRRGSAAVFLYAFDLLEA